MEYITKSDFIRYKICPKLFWNYKNKKDLLLEIDSSVFELGRLVEGFAQKSYIEEEVSVDALGILEDDDKIRITNQYDGVEKIKYPEDYRIINELTKEEKSRRTRNLIVDCFENRKKVNIYEATFIFEDLYVQVDILQVNYDKTITIIENKACTNPTKTDEILKYYFWDLMFQVYVIEKIGYKVKGKFLNFINSDYERIGDLNLDRLFNIIKIDKFHLISSNKKNVGLAKLKYEKKNYILDIERIKRKQVIKNKVKLFEKNDIQNIRNLLKLKDDEKYSIHEGCFKPYSCPFKEICFNCLKEKKLKNDSIFDLKGDGKPNIKDKIILNHLGYKTFDKILEDKTGIINDYFSNSKIKQMKSEIKDIEYWDSKSIISYIKTIENKDLYHLDFETYQQAIPEWDYISPYEQIPFQYSLHKQIWDFKNKKYKKMDITDNHISFLGDGKNDPRRKLAESLVENIPFGSICVAYNIGFEKMILTRLAFLFKDLKDHLESIRNNMFDLMPIYRKKLNYNKQMIGSYSIKYVLPAILGLDNEELNYEKLGSIQNGGDAMNIYPKLKTLTFKDAEKIKKDMFNYCRLDTFAMIRLYEDLLKKLKNDDGKFEMKQYYIKNNFYTKIDNLTKKQILERNMSDKEFYIWLKKFKKEKEKEIFLKKIKKYQDKREKNLSMI